MKGPKKPDSPPAAPAPSLLIRDARQIVTLRGPLRARRGAEMSYLGVLTSAAMLVENGRITQLGPAARIENLSAARKAQEIDAAGCIVLPGLVDCHTHLLFPCPRLTDYTKRIGGASYEEIAHSGGGILSTVRAVRASTVNALQAAAERSARLMVRHGTLLAEVKSGYGLDPAAEIRILRAIGRAAAPIEFVPTCLGAHALPPEFANDPDGYISEVCQHLLPEVERLRLAEFADVYCDHTPLRRQSRYLEAAPGMDRVKITLPVRPLRRVDSRPVGAISATISKP